MSQSARRNDAQGNKALVIVAHPDDEILGCGATIRLFVNRGWRARLVIMTAGVSGRHSHEGSDCKNVTAAQTALAGQMQRASKIVGFESTKVFDFPDNRMDTVSRMDLTHELIPYVQDYKPDLVLTHHHGDYNWDHTMTFDAALMATRPNPPDYTPSELWSFEVPSSTERAFQAGDRTFNPNLYVDVSTTIDQKKRALMQYESEYRPYPHPRSIEALEYLARRRGNEVGMAYAEAFHMVRRLVH